MRNNKTLLTIAIPTYNRAKYLDLCLTQIFNQVSGFEDVVDVYVSDNCSTDDTMEIVEKYRSHKCRLVCSRNTSNIGAAANQIKCFAEASGKYVVVFSDDDVLVDGALAKILTVLRGADYGVVTLSAYGFKDSYVRKPLAECRVRVYKNLIDYFTKVHVFITYLSGNIINKELIPPDVKPDVFSGTLLAQLGWLIPAALAAPANALIEGGLVAGKENNSGGYSLCKVFGEAFDEIFGYFIGRGSNPEYFDAIKKKALTEFFPSNIYTARAYGRFDREDYYSALRPIYGGDFRFWLFVVPAIKLPLTLANLWRKVMSGFLKIYRALFVRETGEELAL